MNPPLRSTQRETLRPLTSLRFVAALLVVLYHCEPTAAIGTAYALGHAGVGFFFVLSGFILTFTYYRNFDGPLAWDRVRAFYVARVARIYPLHIVAMVLAIAVLWRFGSTYWDSSGNSTREIAVISQAMLIQSWIPSEKVYFGINSPAWSISVEAFFYAVFPFLIASLLRSFGRRSSRTVLLAASLPWLMLLSIVLVPHPIAVWTAFVVPPIRLVDFIVGMMVGIAFLRHRETAAKLPCATILELVAIATVVGAVLLSPRIPEALRYALFLMPFWALLIWVFVWQQGGISKILSHPVFVRLGEASFAIYLVHWIVIQAVASTLSWKHVIPAMVLTLGTTLGLSLALFTLVEQPMRRRIKRRFSGVKSEYTAAATEPARQGSELLTRGR